MNTTAVTAHTESTVARPLNVLVPLIKQDLKDAKEASDQAALPYWAAAGNKMCEAKESFDRATDFYAWVERNFDLSRRQADRYMDEADYKPVANKTNARHGATLSGAIRARGGNPRGSHHGGTWYEPVREAVGKINVEALKQDALAKQEERALQRKLALSLIDIGYKALAAKLHPDKGGSREAMARLNRVRELLKGAVT